MSPTTVGSRYREPFATLTGCEWNNGSSIRTRPFRLERCDLLEHRAELVKCLYIEAPESSSQGPWAVSIARFHTVFPGLAGLNRPAKSALRAVSAQQSETLSDHLFAHDRQAGGPAARMRDFPQHPSRRYPRSGHDDRNTVGDLEDLAHCSRPRGHDEFHIQAL